MLSFYELQEAIHENFVEYDASITLNEARDTALIKHFSATFACQMFQRKKQTGKLEQK